MDINDNYGKAKYTKIKYVAKMSKIYWKFAYVTIVCSNIQLKL